MVMVKKRPWPLTPCDFPYGHGLAMAMVKKSWSPYHPPPPPPHLDFGNDHGQNFLQFDLVGNFLEFRLVDYIGHGKKTTMAKPLTPFNFPHMVMGIFQGIMVKVSALSLPQFLITERQNTGNAGIRGESVVSVRFKL